MLSPDVRLDGFTVSDWTRFLSLFRPRSVTGGPRHPDRPKGGVVAVHGGGRIRKLVHTEVGRLRLTDAARAWPLTAQDLASRNHASWGLILEMGTLERIMDRFGERANRYDDLTAQLLSLFQLVREELASGHAEFWPHRLHGFPLPPSSVVTSTLDSICPIGKTLVVGIFEGGDLWTSIAFSRKQTGIDRILGPEQLRADMGLLSGDWHRDYRHLCRAVEDECGPLALGCFSETETIRQLLVDSTPGAWSRAVAIREVILSPVPAALAIPIGLDAGRAALSALKSLAERLDPVGVVLPTIRSFVDNAKDDELARILGFHPLELLRRLLSRDN